MINKIKNSLKNKDNKSLVENFFSLGALQLVNLILPLVVLPYLIRILGFNYYGILVFAASFIAYFASFTDYSFKISATRDVAIFRDNQKKLNLIYSRVLTIKTILLLISWVIIGVTIYLVPMFYNEKLVFSLTALMLFGYMLFPEWFFQGIEKMKYIALLNVGIKLFFTICIFVFVKSPEDYWKYPLLNSVGYIGAGLVGQYIMYSKYNIRFVWLKKRIIINTFKDNFPIFINQFVPNLYNNTSTFLLGLLTNSSLVGIYDALKKIVDLVTMLISVISRVFFPYLNRKKNAFESYKKYMLILGVVLTFLPILFSKLIFWFLDIHNKDGFFVLSILSLSIFFYLLYDVFGLNYFIIRRQDKIVMKNTLTASLIGLITSFPLIIFFGIYGAAINLTLARALMGIRIYQKYKIFNNDKLHYKKL